MCKLWNAFPTYCKWNILNFKQKLNIYISDVVKCRPCSLEIIPAVYPLLLVVHGAEAPWAGDLLLYDGGYGEVVVVVGRVRADPSQQEWRSHLQLLPTTLQPDKKVQGFIHPILQSVQLQSS